MNIIYIQIYEAYMNKYMGGMEIQRYEALLGLYARR
jgi:hypothetical protein